MPERGGVFDHALLLHHLKGRQRRGHCQIVLTESVGVDDAVLHGIEHGVHDLRGSDHGAHRNIAARERFGHADYVGLHFRPVLPGEPLARSAQAALDFIDHEERPGFAAQPLGLGKVSLGDNFAALALHRLEHEGGDIFPEKRALERRQIIERDCLRSGHEIAEPLAEKICAVKGEGPDCQAVKSVVDSKRFSASGWRTART